MDTQDFFLTHAEIFGSFTEMGISNKEYRDFTCYSCEGLKSLEGMPKKITGLVDLHSNKLSSLEWCAAEVNNFYVQFNYLKSFARGPNIINGLVNARQNNLTSLEGLPDKIGGSLNVSANALTNFIGCPSEIGGIADFTNNSIASLEGCPNKISGDFDLSHNQLTSLQGIHKYFKNGWIDGAIILSRNQITSHVLGLILIDKLKLVRCSMPDNNDLKQALKIINRHLAAGRDIIDCQQDLIHSGYKQFAQL